MQKDCGETTRYHMVKIGCTVAHQEEYDVFLKIMINTVLPYDLFHGLFWFLAMSIMNPSIKPYPFPFHHVDFNNHDNHAGLDQWSTKQCFKLLGFFMIWWFPLPEQVVPTGNEERVIKCHCFLIHHWWLPMTARVFHTVQPFPIWVDHRWIFFATIDGFQCSYHWFPGSSTFAHWVNCS